MDNGGDRNGFRVGKRDGFSMGQEVSASLGACSSEGFDSQGQGMGRAGGGVCRGDDMSTGNKVDDRLRSGGFNLQGFGTPDGGAGEICDGSQSVGA